MQRTVLLLAGLFGLLLVTGLALAASSRPLHEGPVYAVADVHDQLHRDRGAWVGRTVVLRAIAEPCPWWEEQTRLQACAGQELVLIGTAADAPAAPVPLLPAAPHPLLALVRRLPVLGDLLPRPAAVPMLVPARFRVRLQALPPGSCEQPPCDDAVLLDAAPGAL